MGPRIYFENINLSVSDRDRIGLVGPNGSGKTTLLQLLAGHQAPYRGEIMRQKEITMGYLQQEAVLTFAGQKNTIYEEMLSVFSGLLSQENRLREIEKLLEGGAYSEEMMAEYGRLQESYERAGGYQYQIEIKRVLLGLGFETDAWNIPLTHLSGGQKTRILLGRLLLEAPDLLILDEPSNHLDTTAVEWLEKTLRTWQGALLIVSHDRYFLDRVVNRVWELTPVQLKTYKGNYTSYVEQRQLAWVHEAALFEAEKARLERELEFIRKNIAGGKTDIAKGKLRRLTRDIVLIETHGVTAVKGKNWLQVGERVRPFSVNEAGQRIQTLPSPASRRPQLNIRLEPEQRSGRFVLRSKRLEIGYADASLFTSDDLDLERLDCAALIGPNGSGKSTFLRTLMGEISPRRGKIRFGDGLVKGYFAQGHEQLNLENKVIDEVMNHRAMSIEDARNYLGRYLFRGDDVFKRVRELSGGERGRLALSLLALAEANFLLLDEPTNHLDIPSQEVLQSVLEQFEGTIILVSHDRYLVDRLATQIWELRADHLTVYDTTYEMFLAAREFDENESSSKVDFHGEEKAQQPVDLRWVAEVQAAPKLNKKEQQQRQRMVHDLREQIEETEAWLDQLEFDFRRAEKDGREGRLAELGEERQAARQELEKLTSYLDQLQE